MEGQGRIGTGRDDQMSIGREMVEQKFQALIHGWGMNHVQIIQQQYDLPAGMGQIVSQAGKGPRQWAGLRRLQHQASYFTGSQSGLLQGGNQIIEKDGWIVVTFIQRKPGKYLGIGMEAAAPIGQQGGFTVTGRSADQN
jgi:hypothetical protein